MLKCAVPGVYKGHTDELYVIPMIQFSIQNTSSCPSVINWVVSYLKKQELLL